MKIDGTLIARGILAALVIINAGIGGLHFAPEIEAAAGLAVGAAIAFLATIIPQPVAVLRSHYQTYRRLNATGRLDT